MKKVYVSDAAAVEDLLASVNGRLERSITLKDITTAIREAERLLSALKLKVAEQRKVSITVNPERNRQPSAKSYRFTTQAVEVLVEKNSTGWYLASVERKFSLSATVANSRDFWVNIPTELFSKEAAAAALGVKMKGPRVILAQEEVLEMEWHVPGMPAWDWNEEECLAAFEKFHNVELRGTARDIYMHCAPGVYSDYN